MRLLGEGRVFSSGRYTMLYDLALYLARGLGFDGT